MNRRHRPGTRKFRDRCGPTQRTRYRTESAAKLALQSAIDESRHGEDPQHRARRRERRVYPCDLCRGWHLTSQPRDYRV